MTFLFVETKSGEEDKYSRHSNLILRNVKVSSTSLPYINGVHMHYNAYAFNSYVLSYNANKQALRIVKWWDPTNADSWERIQFIY